MAPGRTRAAAVAAVSEESEDARRKRLLRKAYSEATQTLREKHRGDFEAAYAEAAQQLGVDWKPRPNAEQRAQQQFEELVTQFPYLLDRVDALRAGEAPDPDDPQGGPEEQ